MLYPELHQPQFSFDVAQSTFLSNFSHYTRLSSSNDPDGERMVWASAILLELFAFVGCTAEEAERAGLELGRFARERPRELVESVRAQCGIDFDRTFSDAARELDLPLGHNEPSGTDSIQVEDLVRPLETVVAACPIGELSDLASRIGLEGLGHRCRVAYDAIKAFLYRNDVGRKARVALVGRKYMVGALSASEVATLLQLDRPDAVALLERSGFARPVEAIILDDELRGQYLEVIRKRRLDGPPFRSSPKTVAAEVIASERLEGIDARPWLLSGQAGEGS